MSLVPFGVAGLLVICRNRFGCRSHTLDDFAGAGDFRLQGGNACLLTLVWEVCHPPAKRTGGHHWGSIFHYHFRRISSPRCKNISMRDRSLSATKASS